MGTPRRGYSSAKRTGKRRRDGSTFRPRHPLPGLCQSAQDRSQTWASPAKRWAGPGRGREGTRGGGRGTNRLRPDFMEETVSNVDVTIIEQLANDQPVELPVSLQVDFLSVYLGEEEDNFSASSWWSPTLS